MQSGCRHENNKALCCSFSSWLFSATDSLLEGGGRSCSWLREALHITILHRHLDRNHARKTMLPSRLMFVEAPNNYIKKTASAGMEGTTQKENWPPYCIAAEKGNHCYQLHGNCHHLHWFHGGIAWELPFASSTHNLKLFSHMSFSFSHFSGSFISLIGNHVVQRIHSS